MAGSCWVIDDYVSIYQYRTYIGELIMVGRKDTLGPRYTL